MPADPKTLTRIFSSPEEISHRVDASLIKGLESQFPIEGKNYILRAVNFRPERKNFTHDDEKTAILESRSLTYPIKADLQLVDKTTGQVVSEQKNFSLMDSFHLTGKHTMLYQGNNYAVSNQLQLRPGVYTRFRDTGVLESHFNTAKGQTFYLTLDPQSEMFILEVGSSKIPVIPLLTEVFKVTPNEAAPYVPKDLWNKNVAAVHGKENRFLADMYQRLVSTSKQDPKATPEKMREQLQEAMANSLLSARTTEATLGKAFTGVSGETVLRAMKNLEDVYRGERQEDNRDSLQFKRVQNLPDFLATRFDKQHQTVKRIKMRMARELDRVSSENPSLKGVFSPKPFNKFFTDYILSSQLVATPEETNPIESIEHVAKVTVLGKGEGGIGEERGVPMGARDIHPSHLGIIDPSRTPESSHAGIDQRFTIRAHRDAEGNLYASVVDKAGKQQFLSVHEMMTHTIGFPPIKASGQVQAQIHGELGQCDAKKVDYWLSDNTDIYTITTNLVPFLNSNSPGRLTMAGKAIPQALSLVNREAPLVQTTDKSGTAFVKSLARIVSTSSAVHGKVVAADSKAVTIAPAEGGKPILVKAVKNLPFNMKGFHDDEKPVVNVGDIVKPGDPLFESNYVKNGVLALGKNLTAAYIPWKGYNHEDGLVLSRSAADSLSSHHAYKIDYDVNDSTVAKKAILITKFPGTFTKEQLANLDEYGYAKVGSVLKPGDPVYAVLEKREPNATDKMLGRLHKSLMNPFTLRTEPWNHDQPGTVVDAHTTGKTVRFLVRSVKHLEIGDKLTGLHGNKGIVSLILDDHEMPYVKATGKPVDILLNPASVTSRVNLGQLMETVASKIAQKTGKPYMIHNFEKGSNVEDLKKELESLGGTDSEEIVDPVTNRVAAKVLTGPSYFLKLYKTSDQNWSARNVGGYDNNEQPTKGGEEGAKSEGYMEMLGLIGSNARKNLKEISTLKSELNTDYWNKFRMGEPLPKPKTTFATQKFLDYLTGSGIKTTLRDGKLTAAPLTDADILGMSHGEIKDALMVNAKHLEPEKGGLYDPVSTGGLQGTRWSHYRLAEALPNPLMEKPIKSILGLNTKEFDGIAKGSIGVTKVGSKFVLHNLATGKPIRDLKVNSFENRVFENEPEEPEEDDVEGLDEDKPQS